MSSYSKSQRFLSGFTALTFLTTSLIPLAPAVAMKPSQNQNLVSGMLEEDRRPFEHKCPITLEVMEKPMVAEDGHSYEEAAILQHFKVNGAKSPSTGLPLKSTDLFENHALKIMIQEWKPGRQGEPSELETRDAASIAQRVKEEFRKNADLLKPEKGAKGQHIVAFLGNTGAGKSTLINFLAGKRLQISEDEEEYLLADQADPTAMAIGLGGGSETLYPKSIDVEGLRFFDLPGFNDTDGSERNLVNAAFIRQILLDAASVRLVFVVGQDQFTSDRSASVKQLFHSIKQLFVADQGMNLIDNGLFVATKVTCKANTPMVDFLLKKTNSKDKAELHQQLQSWSQNQKLNRLFHPKQDSSNRAAKTEMLRLIKATTPSKIQGINVSALYPSDTKSALERLFLSEMETTFKRKLASPLTTLSDYDKKIALYTGSFWQTFHTDLCREEEAIALLKEFSMSPYTKALRTFEQGNESKRQAHIKNLREKRQERVEDIEKRTELRTKEVISALVPQQRGDEFVFFDFAYHPAYHTQVCGTDSIHQLATDVSEQEIVRESYAGFISRHSHQQMLRWQQKFGGVEELREQLKATQERLRVLEEPFIKARQAEEQRKQEEEKKLREVNRKAAEEQQRREEAEKLRLSPPLWLKQQDQAVYQQFLNGKLIYRPKEGSDAGKIEMRIADLANPLEGTFDLSRCGDAGQYLSIATGYKKEMLDQNENKVEVWLSPRFLIEKELTSSAGHFKEIMGTWDGALAPIGVFFTRGNRDNLAWYDYVTNTPATMFSSLDVYKLWNEKVSGYIRMTSEMHTLAHFFFFLN